MVTTKQLSNDLGYNFDQYGYPHEYEEIRAPMDLIQRYQGNHSSLNAEIYRTHEQIVDIL